MKHTLRLFRRLQLTTSVVVFLLVFFVCYKITGFDITTIPLSKWGITESVSWLWNSCLILLGASCFYNIYHYLQAHPHLQFKKYFTWAFFVQCLNIVLLGIIVSGYLLHAVIAYFYFFAMPLLIFVMAAVNRYRITFVEWIVHSSLSALMIIIPLSALFVFHGKAIAETTHSILFIIWNVYLLKESF